MARKSRPHDEELPFVALMDTMTNVVGVLIIVLVLIGLGLAKSVKKVLSDLPLVNAEEHEQLKSEMDKFKGLRDPDEVKAELAKIQAELQTIAAELQQLTAKRDENPLNLIDVEKLAKDLETFLKTRDVRKQAVDVLLAEIDKLKLKLDTTPRYTPPPAIGVRLPKAQPMPQKAEIHRFLISEGRILYLPSEDFKKKVEEELRKGTRDYTLKQEVMKDAAGKQVTRKEANGQDVIRKKMVFDGPKMTAFFNGLKMGTREIKVEVVQQTNAANVQFRMTPKPGVGETIEQIKSGGSKFRSQFTSIRSNKDAVLWFHVCRDSIPTYLAIRDMVDAADDIPVGWDIYDRPVYSQNMPSDYLVDFTPPPPPPVVPGAPAPVKIAAPQMTLD